MIRGSFLMDKVPFDRRDVLFSVKPFYANKILDGEKTVELRRKFPETVRKGTVAVIYSSSPVRAVVGVARIESVSRLSLSEIWKLHGEAACITKRDFESYFTGLRFGYAIGLAEVRELINCVSLAKLRCAFGIAPPQSYRYLGPHLVERFFDEQFQVSHRHEYRNRA